MSGVGIQENILKKIW